MKLLALLLAKWGAEQEPTPNLDRFFAGCFWLVYGLYWWLSLPVRVFKCERYTVKRADLDPKKFYCGGRGLVEHIKSRSGLPYDEITVTVYPSLHPGYWVASFRISDWFSLQVKYAKA